MGLPQLLCMKEIRVARWFLRLGNSVADAVHLGTIQSSLQQAFDSWYSPRVVICTGTDFAVGSKSSVKKRQMFLL